MSGARFHTNNLIPTIQSLPTEISLQIFSHLSSQILLDCALVSRRWRALADDQFLWKNLCHARGWEWKQPSRIRDFDSIRSAEDVDMGGSDDEGMGEDEDADDLEGEGSNVLADEESSVDVNASSSPTSSILKSLSSLLFDAPSSSTPARTKPRNRHSAPSILPSLGASQLLKPNYKLLYQTRTRLSNRFFSSSYRLSLLQNRGTPTNAHTNTIYCLQLYTDPSTGTQTLFTGSKDKTVREWNLTTGCVERVLSGLHECSVLSICVSGGYVASGGSDRRVVVWDLEADRLVKVICDHEDSVLCVRFDEEKLVSCSKGEIIFSVSIENLSPLTDFFLVTLDRTVRTYSFPDLVPQFVLGAHRAAVNAVSISKTLIISGSGDRSIRLWDAQTGKLLRTFENHHSRGYVRSPHHHTDVRALTYFISPLTESPQSTSSHPS
jgi:WD40 repeat protein